MLAIFFLFLFAIDNFVVANVYNNWGILKIQFIGIWLFLICHTQAYFRLLFGRPMESSMGWQQKFVGFIGISNYVVFIVTGSLVITFSSNSRVNFIDKSRSHNNDNFVLPPSSSPPEF